MKHSKWGLGLNHDVTTSDRSVPTPTFLKIDPKLRGVSGQGWCHIPIHSLSRCRNSLYIYDMNL